MINSVFHFYRFFIPAKPTAYSDPNLMEGNVCASQEVVSEPIQKVQRSHAQQATQSEAPGLYSNPEVLAYSSLSPDL